MLRGPYLGYSYELNLQDTRTRQHFAEMKTPFLKYHYHNPSVHPLSSSRRAAEAPTLTDEDYRRRRRRRLGSHTLSYRLSPPLNYPAYPHLANDDPYPSPPRLHRRLHPLKSPVHRYQTYKTTQVSKRAGESFVLVGHQAEVCSLETSWSREYGTALRIAGCVGTPTLVLTDPLALRHVLHGSGPVSGSGYREESSGYRYPKPRYFQLGNQRLFGRGILWAEVWSDGDEWWYGLWVMGLGNGFGKFALGWVGLELELEFVSVGLTRTKTREKVSFRLQASRGVWVWVVRRSDCLDDGWLVWMATESGSALGSGIATATYIVSSPL
ncbi:hypothetical protein D9758_003462 [Tetrapyrgos nigripes]|uniref:Uncharacterized protein n=1 Tax=Tetrapyrgos nigripes TaxID=182062 RepID=A0A8H5LW09_9AGAR|nr:hypothetical protein D9758_003462 [Tetrapyrgos nigripes]